ncbi:MAG: Na/Pi cotransporter family protein, partial [Clostridia bacterium]|nr:Na/Pi cotransporter family protein [Clostridia bacterium]
QAFADLLSRFSTMPLLGILTGLVLTVIVQSSSAMVGILQALSSTGAMTFNLVYPIIMGINLGTCVTTAMVCSIGTSKDAKRTGIVHIVFNTVGTILFMIAMTLLQKAGFWPNLWGSVVNSGGIADFQTIFNLLTAVVLLPFTGVLVKIACKMVKDEEQEADMYPELSALDRKLMISPALALQAVGKSLAVMARAARDNTLLSLQQFDKYDENTSEVINAREERLDSFTDIADNYLIELSRSIEDQKDSRELNILMQIGPNLERIGDYATNYDELAQRMAAADLKFSDGARQELTIMTDAIGEILRLTEKALETGSEETARRIEPLEEVIDDMVLMLKNRHADRLRRGVCVVDNGLIFMETLTNLERAADQCSSIAMLLLSRNNPAIMENHHQYIQDLHNSGDVSYLAEQENRRQQYLVPLENIKF